MIICILSLIILAARFFTKFSAFSSRVPSILLFRCQTNNQKLQPFPRMSMEQKGDDDDDGHSTSNDNENDENEAGNDGSPLHRRSHSHTSRIARLSMTELLKAYDTGTSTAACPRRHSLCLPLTACVCSQTAMVSFRGRSSCCCANPRTFPASNAMLTGGRSEERSTTPTASSRSQKLPVILHRFASLCLCLSVSVSAFGFCPFWACSRQIARTHDL